MSVDAGDGPVTTDPNVAKLVGTADLVNILQGDELTNERLPEIETVLGRV